MPSVDVWTSKDVSIWLKKNGFDHYVSLFRDDHKIDGKCLLTMSEDDLRCPPLQLPILGDIKRLGIAIRILQQENARVVYNLLSPPSSASQLSMVTNQTNHKDNYHYLRSNGGNTPMSDSGNGDGDGEVLSEVLKNSMYSFKPEIGKAIIAMMYFFTATWITAIVMVIVHDRVPDMETYPPLPDIFLDNVPLIPWAFQMCEVCGVILCITWFTVLFFHRHRFILLRRMFSLFGSVFFIRCVTMLITSLSVPGRHLQCKARPYGRWTESLLQAFIIWQGGGLSIQGVRTCGDYMFSGHTVVLTLLNFFITEYTPRRLYFLHTFSWVLNLFGVFFILAGHEHYSIDVFIAFYISTRLFLYYHTLANNRSLYQGDSFRTRIWFPLFYFFESGVCGHVPNEFENPFLIFSEIIKIKFHSISERVNNNVNVHEKNKKKQK